MVHLIFRGTSPLNLINWQTDIDLGMSHYAGFGGVRFARMHAKVCAALPSLPLTGTQTVITVR